MMSVKNNSEVMFSIIIPVYNGASHLSASLESLLAQTESRWEAICVNDGSTDNTQERLEEWATKDARIRVYEQANAGVSVARNTALSHAQGIYVVHLDADDRFKPAALERILEAIQAHPESMVCFGVEYVYEDKPDMRKNMGAYSGAVNLGDHLRPINSDIISRMHAYVCNKVYTLDKLRKRGIEFPPGVPLNEDLCFFLNYAYYEDSFYCLTEPLYEYLQRADSAVGITVKFDRPLEHYTNHITLYIPLMKKLNKLPIKRRYSWQKGLYQRVARERRAIIAWMHSYGITRPELETAMAACYLDFQKATPFCIKVAVLIDARLPRVYKLLARLFAS